MCRPLVRLPNVSRYDQDGRCCRPRAFTNQPDERGAVERAVDEPHVRHDHGWCMLVIREQFDALWPRLAPHLDAVVRQVVGIHRARVVAIDYQHLRALPSYAWTLHGAPKSKSHAVAEFLDL